MKLTDLEPEFLGAGGEGVYNADGTPATSRDGVGVLFNCPCGCDSQCYVPFANPLDGGPPLEASRGWQRTGDTFETLTLRPSIQRVPVNGHGCRWHGYITSGAIETL